MHDLFCWKSLALHKKLLSWLFLFSSTLWTRNSMVTRVHLWKFFDPISSAAWTASPYPVDGELTLRRSFGLTLVFFFFALNLNRFFRWIDSFQDLFQCMSQMVVRLQRSCETCLLHILCAHYVAMRIIACLVNACTPLLLWLLLLLFW